MTRLLANIVAVVAQSIVNKKTSTESPGRASKAKLERNVTTETTNTTTDVMCHQSNSDIFFRIGVA
jgi:hypothetical protein